jgi:hypothetical protein
MHSPSAPELLRGVSTQLQSAVLPAVQDPAAQRQLKAALHILRRLERSGSRMQQYLRADILDISGFLGEPKPQIGLDTDLRALHDELEQRLIEAEERGIDEGALRALQRRMLEREAHAWAK